MPPKQVAASEEEAEGDPLARSIAVVVVRRAGGPSGSSIATTPRPISRRWTDASAPITAVDLVSPKRATDGRAP